jgi:hypothetical protein
LSPLKLKHHYWMWVGRGGVGYAYHIHTGMQNLGRNYDECFTWKFNIFKSKTFRSTHATKNVQKCEWPDQNSLLDLGDWVQIYTECLALQNSSWSFGFPHFLAFLITGWSPHPEC